MSKKDRATETFLSGLVFTAGFGVVLGLSGAWGWIFPLMFLGVVPLVKGARGLAVRWRRQRIAPEEREALAEKEVLRIAQQVGGRVTPALIALKTQLSTDKAEEILQRLVKNNHANMDVTSEGRIEYEIPEFRRRLES